MSEITVHLEQKVVSLTPEILAKAFWSMDCEDQAKFFDELGKVIEVDHVTNKHSYSYGELQWCYLKDELRRPGMERANNVHMALSAFAFDFWAQKNNGAREGL
ncbi:MAG: hypothetical protein RSG92_29275 [Pseudomonas sp.]